MTQPSALRELCERVLETENQIEKLAEKTKDYSREKRAVYLDLMVLDVSKWEDLYMIAAPRLAKALLKSTEALEWYSGLYYQSEAFEDGYLRFTAQEALDEIEKIAGEP